MSLVLRTLCLLVVLLSLPSIGLGFEIEGIKAGTAQNDVLVRLQRQGFTVRAEETTPNLYFAFRDDEHRHVSFCKGRLISYGYNVPGGIRSFIRRVHELTTTRGAGAYSSMSTESTVGELNSLAFAWREGLDTLKITYFAPSERASESVSVLHTTVHTCPH
jgi:hypothetical protein